MILSEKLTELRKRSGLSQEELAIKLGISRQAVHKWETTLSKPDVEKLLKLSKIFGITVDTLLDDSAELPQNVKVAIPDGGFGKVTVLPYEYKEDPVLKFNEYNLMPQYQERKKKALIVNWVINAAIIIFWVAFFIILFNDNFAANYPDIYNFLNEHSLIPFLVGNPIIFIVKHILLRVKIKRIKNEHKEFIAAYRKNKLDKSLNLLKNLGHNYIIQIADFDWFFFDNDKRSFGFFFDEKEQFICPIQNYISISNDDDSVYNLYYADEAGKHNDWPFCISYDYAPAGSKINALLDFEKSKGY